MIPGSANPLLLKSAAAAGAYQVSRSLRFNSSDSAFCSRTPAVAGDRKKWTWSGWVKRGALNGNRQVLFGTGDSGLYNSFEVEFFGDILRISDTGESGGGIDLRTTQVFRDCSAWGHLLVSLDTAQTTASDRANIYWNGVKITTFSTATYPGLSTTCLFNTTAAHGIGRAGVYNAQYLDGCLADIHFIDGQALTPSSFTEVSATTGQLIPKTYTGTFGTNGFWLKFSDNSAATAATLGKDYSGNSNNWTPNNLSVTAGAGNDSLVDTPTSISATDTGIGGEIRGNYATLNPLDNGGVVLSNGNLDVSNGSAHEAVRATIKLPTTGKWYAEVTLSNFTSGSNVLAFGIDYSNATTPSGWSAGGHLYIAVNSNNLIINLNGSDVFSTSTTTSGAVLQVAYDADSQKLWLGFNNTWRDSSYGTTGNPAAGTNPTSTSVTGGFLAVNSYEANASFNAGQRAFAYTAPSGFKALCDTNLPEGTITTSGTYTGNGVADGPFVYLNGVPTAMTVGGNAVTFGTHADKLSNGFKLRTTSTTYNQNALSYSYSITATGAKFKYARAQPNP